MVHADPKKGHLLIAEPAIIGDISFNRAVILLADHNDSGTVGFILNKPLSFTLDELVPEISQNFKVYNGGPVEQDNLYFIHTSPALIPDSLEIASGVFWGGNFDAVVDAVNNHKLSEKDIQFFLGYSGWDVQQLHSELASNSWILTTNNYRESIIEKMHSAFWREKMIELGGSYSIWSNAPENPSLN